MRRRPRQIGRIGKAVERKPPHRRRQVAASFINQGRGLALTPHRRRRRRLRFRLQWGRAHVSAEMRHKIDCRWSRPSATAVDTVLKASEGAADVVMDGLKSSGKGYNTRVEKLLEEALESGRL